MNGQRGITEALARLGLQKPEILALDVGAQREFKIGQGALVVLVGHVNAREILGDLRCAGADGRGAI